MIITRTMSHFLGFHLPLLIFSIFIHLLLFNQSIVTAKDDNSDGASLIKRTCNGTEFSETCISVFESDPRSRAATNQTSLCSIGLNITYEKTNEALSYFVEAKKKVTGRLMKSSIFVCIRDYEFGMFNMNESGFPGFKRGDYEEAKWGVGFCNYAASDCLDTSIQMYVHENELLFNFTGAVIDILDSFITA